MKRMMIGLMAILTGVMLAACGGKNDSKEKNDDKSTEAASAAIKLAHEIDENGNDWDLETWEEKIEKFREDELAFYESMPTQDEIDEYEEACEEVNEAARKLTEDGNYCFHKANREVGSNLKNKIHAAKKKAIKQAAKKEQVDDDDVPVVDYDAVGTDADYDFDNYD